MVCSNPGSHSHSCLHTFMPSFTHRFSGHYWVPSVCQRRSGYCWSMADKTGTAYALTLLRETEVMKNYKRPARPSDCAVCGGHRIEERMTGYLRWSDRKDLLEGVSLELRPEGGRAGHPQSQEKRVPSRGRAASAKALRLIR